MPQQQSATCPLPAHGPLLLGRSSLPFASLQTLKTLRWGIRLPGFKHLKVFKTLQIPCGSFHQALWPSAFAVPGLQCAGKGQAATLEQQRLTARGLGGSGARELEGFKRFKCLKPGKRMPQRRVVRV